MRNTDNKKSVQELRNQIQIICFSLCNSHLLEIPSPNEYVLKYLRGHRKSILLKPECTSGILIHARMWNVTIVPESRMQNWAVLEDVFEVIEYNFISFVLNHYFIISRKSVHLFRPPGSIDCCAAPTVDCTRGVEVDRKYCAVWVAAV